MKWIAWIATNFINWHLWTSSKFAHGLTKPYLFICLFVCLFIFSKIFLSWVFQGHFLITRSVIFKVRDDARYLFRTKYSRMDQVHFWNTSLKKNKNHIHIPLLLLSHYYYLPIIKRNFCCIDSELLGMSRTFAIAKH